MVGEALVGSGKHRDKEKRQRQRATPNLENEDRGRTTTACVVYVITRSPSHHCLIDILERS